MKEKSNEIRPSADLRTRQGMPQSAKYGKSVNHEFGGPCKNLSLDFSFVARIPSQPEIHVRIACFSSCCATRKPGVGKTGEWDALYLG
jgi:hypothetical protein